MVKFILEQILTLVIIIMASGFVIEIIEGKSLWRVFLMGYILIYTVKDFYKIEK